MSTVPPIDVEPSGPPDAAGQRLNAIELRLLDAGAKAKENVNREADQRYWLRWLAVGTVVLLISGMAYVLSHVAHQLLYMHAFNAPAALLVATYIAPIVSMTTLALALMVAAFRGFKNDDETSGASLVLEGAKSSGIMN